MKLFYTNGMCWHLLRIQKRLPVIPLPRMSSADKRKWLMRAHITTLLLIITIVQVSASSFAQKLNFTAKSVTFKELFREIKKQTGYTAFYSNKKLDDQHRISASFVNAPLDEVLTQSLKGSNLTFKIEDKAIYIHEAGKPSLLDQLIARFQEIDVRGMVVDENGLPMVGANVKIKSSGRGVITDAKGNFMLTRINVEEVIVISFLGYQNVELQAKADLGRIQLKLSDSKLDEVQVIAYGQTSQRLSTGNVTTITAKDIEKSPVTNVLAALQGKVTGLNINQASGYSNSSFSVAIQGQNSMNNGNDPFYVVDGVPYPAQNIYAPTMNGTTLRGNTLAFLNPNDIESVSVLKDADATAIYGSRAANGAILITTKKGKQGKPKVVLDYQHGFSKVARHLDMMNTEQYLTMRREALKNDGLAVRPTDYDLNGFWDSNRNTDWQKELIGRTAQYINLNGSISGGTNTTQYLIGGTYHNETSVLPTKISNDKGGMHFNLNTNTEDNKFQLQFSANYLIDVNRLPTSDIANVAFTLAPNAPALYNADGSLNFMYTPQGRATFNNPLALLNRKLRVQTNNLVSSLNLNYNILPGLSLKGNLGYSNMQTDQLAQYPLTSFRPDLWPTTTRWGYYGNYSIVNIQAEPQISYSHIFAGGKLDAMIGGTYQRNNSKGNEYLGTGFTTDAAIADVHSAAQVVSSNAIAAIYKYLGVFGKLSYTFKDKYLLNLSARRDGSSRFGPANRFHSFAAIGTGWIFSQEEWLKDKLPFMSFGKLRFSFGTTGNDQIGDYSYLELYQPFNPGVPYRGINSIVSDGIYNPYLQWESTKKTNFGLDLGFFKDRLIVKADYNINRSSNQLLSMPLPIITGRDQIVTNLPATVQNTGLELSTTAEIIKKKKFGWSMNFNITLPKNKLVKFDGIENTAYRNMIIGKSISMIRLYHYAGVNPQTGFYQFEDHNGNLTSDPAFLDDQYIISDFAPKAYGGLGTSLRYGDLSLDVQFSFMKRIGQNFNAGNAFPGYFNYNQPEILVDRWTQPGDQAAHQLYSSNGTGASSYFAFTGSDAGVSDASYARLKNISLSWQLPKTFLRHIGVDNARIYGQGQNLLTITKYKGLDPETLNNFGLPPLRTFVIGLQIGF